MVVTDPNAVFIFLFCNSQACFTSEAWPRGCAHNPMAARRHGSPGEGQAKGIFLLSLLTSNECSFCLRTREVLVAMGLGTALAFDASAQRLENNKTGKRHGTEQQRLLFRPLQFVLYCVELLPVHAEG